MAAIKDYGPNMRNLITVLLGDRMIIDQGIRSKSDSLGLDAIEKMLVDDMSGPTKGQGPTHSSWPYAWNRLHRTMNGTSKPTKSTAPSLVPSSTKPSSVATVWSTMIRLAVWPASLGRLGPPLQRKGGCGKGGATVTPPI